MDWEYIKKKNAKVLKDRIESYEESIKSLKKILVDPKINKENVLKSIKTIEKRIDDNFEALKKIIAE